MSLLHRFSLLRPEVRRPEAPVSAVLRQLSCAFFALFALLSFAAQLSAQIHLDSVSAGVVAVHDHVSFDFHNRVLNDPYPHETKEGYAFDGGDLVVRAHWHWQGAALMTRVQFSPTRRAHFAYDEDTDFKPNTNFTHGNQGVARSRTFAITQRITLIKLRRRGSLWGQMGFWDQPTQYSQVETFDLNSNPSLPSNIYTRIIPEQANIHEIRLGLGWSVARPLGSWEIRNSLLAAPLSDVRLLNIIPGNPVSSLMAYGGKESLTLIGPQRGRARALHGLRLALQAGWYHNYGSLRDFRREVFGGRVAWSF